MAEIYADAAAAAVGADDSDEELGAPAGAFVPPGNPFSPASAASRAPPNEERLMQVLENLTILVSNNTAAPREQAIRGRDLAKVLKAPEPFRPKDRDAELSLWANWSWELEQYLSCLDRAFGVELQTIRRRPANPIAHASWTEAEADRSRLLYGVLAGLLHDKGKRVLKSLTDANGFEAYRLLSQDLMPSSRNRILALLQAIHSWPAFDNRTGLMTQLTRFESAVNEYEGLTGTSMSDDNRLAAVLRCLSGQLRTQATVLITESSTYQDLRNLIERWDTSQTKWSTSIASTFGIASSSSGGPAPMEIDRTRTCRYCERKGHLEKDCWLKQKHEKGRVNQVSEVQPSDSASQAAASSTATTAVRRVQVFDLGDTSSWFAGGHVRAVIAEPGLRAKAIQCPTGCMPRGISEFSDFDFLDAMRASHLGLGYPVSDVLTISGVERFECSDGLSDCLDNIFNGFESRGNPVPTGRFEFYDQCSVPEGPILLEQDQCSVPEGPGSECDHSFDMSACDANAGSWCIAASTFDLQDESDCSGIPQFVCAVHSIDMLVHDSEAHEIILDSGADMSCLPLCYATHGTSQGAGGLALKDAQGEPLAVNDLREVDFVLQSEEGEPIVWREVCAIAPVTQPLLCKGKLRAGWWPQRKPTMCLEHDSGIRVPMSFKGNSLCIKAAIYRVGEQSVNPALHVRFVQATIDASMIDAPFGWQMSEQGDMFFRGRGSHFIDPSIVAPVGWPCRTTLVKPCRDGYDHWLLLEHCVSWGELQELSAVLPHGESDVVCVLTTDRAPLEDMMIVPSRSVKDYISWSGPQPADPNAGELDEYEPSDDGMAEAFEPAEVSVSPLPDVEVADAPMPERKSERDVLVYDGVELSLASTLNVIRASCKAAGLSQSGSKQRCLDRLKCYLEKQDIALKSEVAQAVEGDSTRVAKGQAMNKEPSKAERDLHNLTHWPFQGWCDHCLSMRGLEDRHQSIPDSPDRDTPIVSFDFCYTSVTTDDSDLQHHKLTILVAHDTATGSVFGLPVASKGKDDLKFAAIELTRFVQSLGHNTIALQTDNEPSTVALQNLIIGVRTRLNFKTVVRNAAVESHASKGYVEKTVDLLRGLSNVFLDQARAKFGLGPDYLGPSHPLMAWSYVHAAFILNRFAVRGGATAFERATGFRYSGKLGMYAEPVWGYRKGKHKGDRRWHRALMLTKSPSNDMYVLCNSAGVWLTKSIRRNDKPWESEQSLAIDAKGFPWDYQLGLLGTKVVPQARHRLPKPADKGEPDAPQGEVQVEASRMPDMPAMAGIPPAPVPAESVQPPSVAAGTPAPSSRATLLLDRSDRAPTSVVEPAAAPAPLESPMEVAASDPPSPEGGTPVIPMTDDDLLIDVAKRAQDAIDLQPSGQASKYQRIARVGAEELPINDEVLESAPEWEDAERYLEVSDEAAAEWDVTNTEDSHALDNEECLWYDSIPDLSEQQQEELDRIADSFEVQRLLRKGVLEEIGDEVDTSDHKELSSKFVRTWRKKLHKDKMMYFRRSRLVAREYRWLERDREDLYAPATSAITTKLLPWLYCELSRQARESPDETDRIGVIALDVRDAFLNVPQERPMLAKIPGFASRMRFLKMLPGQRDGTARWHQFIMNYIREEHKLTSCAECPSVYKIVDPKGRVNPGLIHVDDLCLVGFVQWLLKELVPSFEKTFEVSYEVACMPGDSFKFLKREHIILDDGILIKPLADHAVNMANLLDVPLHRKFPTPCTKELLMPDASKELDSARAAKYRSAVGIGMYVSQDRSDIAFTVRVLAQNLKAPTERGWQFAQRLAGYLVGTAGYASKVHAKGDRASILEPPDAEECLDGVRLEVFCDADWSGNKQTRRSMSSSSFFLNSCCVYTSCKSQRCVSLSSAESEFYALVSAACDGIYLKRVLEYLLELPVDLLMRTDNSSCRQISLKQGVSKIRHLDGRFLWIQEKTADRTLRVQPVDGRRNPSDLGTKVPCSGSRLRALLCMHDFVCCAGDCIEEVGRAEHDALLEQLQRERETQRVRRLVCKTLKSNGMQSFSTAMMVMMLSLVQGAESSGTRREVGVQTDDDARWAQSLAVLVICTCAILLALKSLSLGRLWTTEGNEDDITLNVSNASTSTEEVYEQGTDGWWNWVPLTFTCSLSAFCLAIMMCLRRVRAALHAAEQENERLSRLIAEMNYDRIAWGEYHEAKDRTRERTLPMPEPNRAIFIDGDAARGSNDVIQHVPELHVYCTLRRGKSYHKSRNCTCLNNADEIVKLGIATARERGYKPCGSCFGGSKKQK
ncbi:unnamed protein product [Symbiodinium sp. CCMP2592]|nr:unnamed protein product [Symbiodinium sp. CCMP2592]